MLLDTGCLTLMAVILHDTGTQTQTLSYPFFFLAAVVLYSNLEAQTTKHWEVCWSQLSWITIWHNVNDVKFISV